MPHLSSYSFPALFVSRLYQSFLRSRSAPPFLSVRKLFCLSAWKLLFRESRFQNPSKDSSLLRVHPSILPRRSPFAETQMCKFHSLLLTRRCFRIKFSRMLNPVAISRKIYVFEFFCSFLYPYYPCLMILNIELTNIIPNLTISTFNLSHIFKAANTFRQNVYNSKRNSLSKRCKQIISNKIILKLVLHLRLRNHNRSSLNSLELLIWKACNISRKFERKINKEESNESRIHVTWLVR